MTTTDNYRTAAIYARVHGSNRGSFAVSRVGDTPFTSSGPAQVIRIGGTWRMFGCRCATFPEPCSQCLILFVGINPGIQFPSRHTDTDWRMAHNEVIKRAIAGIDRRLAAQ